ncbi:hypothetical protein MYCTH_2107129 [Thermothelomyces thermophilus ATCC 42464]|uniref:DUF7905 domain-containing protein n=1 Tax=Thermothelomyces thermophilus (strain ATCC 42464 / BCRC 31852 / DSM 1799) TaxID=573729 RepID=G2Q3N7_THET4|nr:uncharacterized protein MYCTH_2107129 [Thermothelomyces thermophilus ATCC 42464]AEO54390.1 hypothetical protein MYCTH_2107129 [Thermothelomyces thermophilus ATCC 42464]
MEYIRKRKVLTAGADQVFKEQSPNLSVTVHVSWPAPMRGFKDIDPSDVDVAALLNRLAREHKAAIAAEEIGSNIFVTVKATNRAKAQEVIGYLRSQLLYRPGEDSVWRARLLVYPPSDSWPSIVAALQTREGTTGRRITALTSQPLGFVDTSIYPTKAEYKENLTAALNQTAEFLRNNPNGMRMKVQFGSLIVNEWTKDKTEYTLEELLRLINRVGTRGTARMLDTVSETAAKALVNCLIPSNAELPEFTRDYLESGDPDRIFSIILQTKNLNVESNIELVDGQQEKFKNVKRARQYTLGPLAIRQLEKQYRAAEVITICPESFYDWGFKIRKDAAEQDARPSAPFKVEELQQSVKFTGESLQEGFPNMDISEPFLKHNEIQAVYGTTILRYNLSMHYSLDIKFVHQWRPKTPGQKTLPTMATTATVLLYGDDWDFQLRAGVPVPRDWNDSFVAQFLQQSPDDQGPRGMTGEPMNHLLGWVEWIQKALDSGFEQDKVIGNSA